MGQPSLTPAEWIDLLVGRSHDLRQAGVRSLKIGDVEVELAAPDIEWPDGSGKPEAPMPEDPLDDPATFGLEDNQGLPGERWERRPNRDDLDDETEEPS